MDISESPFKDGHFRVTKGQNTRYNNMLPHKPYIYLASVQTYTDLEI
jgi:hypothetical protein